MKDILLALILFGLTLLSWSNILRVNVKETLIIKDYLYLSILIAVLVFVVLFMTSKFFI